MSYLVKLLDGIEVEWKPLGKALVRTKGTNITAGQMKVLHKSGAPLKIFAGGKTIAFVDYDDIPSKDINKEPSIIVKSRGVIEFDFYDKPFSHKNEMWSYHSADENINIKFIYYFLKIQEAHFQNIAGKMQMPQISIPDTDKFNVPLPLIGIQNEIVRILDSFTNLTAELTSQLTAELKARREQYEYYREQLFVFDGMDTPHLLMGDDSIGKFQRGKRFVKEDIMTVGVPCIHYGEMYTHYGTWATKSKSFLNERLVEDKKLRIAETGDVVIVAAGETIEDLGKGTAWLGDKGVVIHDACFSYRSTLNPKYVAYFTRTKQYHNQIKKHISSGKISAIHATGLGKVLIPVPSPEEQERIVSILDKFDVLTSSISDRLPKEIILRKRQYQYYRNLLLTFPKDNLMA